MVFQNDIIAGASGAGGYSIEQSIRFNDDDSSYLERTPGAAGTEETWTYSAWIKRGILSSTMSLFEVRVDGNSYGFMRLEAADSLWVAFNDGASMFGQLRPTQLFRDPSAWYHIILVADTGNGTAGDRLRLYVNGERVTSFSSEVYPTLNSTLYGINWALAHRIGDSPTFANHFDGYMAEINFVDGTAVEPSSFGETNSDTGQWVPKKYAGAYGTNGFYLKGQDSSALGDDTSGNGNDFSSGGLAANDQMSDSPTNNFCTWSSIDTGSGTLSDGNLVLAGTTDRSGTFGMTSGKWAWKVTASANGAFGVVQGGLTGTESTYSALSGDVLEFQFDVDAGTLDVSVDNGAYTSVATGLTSGPYLPLAKAACSADFGQLGFSLDDADFNYLSTSSLPDPAIVDPSAYFQTTLYEGDGSTQSIDQSENSTFSPNFVWIKNRDAADAHALFDTVRGATKVLSSNSAANEATNADTLTAFESDGFALGADVIVNTNAESYVAWQWDAPTTSTNTDGSVSSTLSVSQTSGFSIGTFVGTGSVLTMGHGLGVAPDFVIVRVINGDNNDNWNVYHSALGNTKGIRLNLNAASGTTTQYWNNTSPTSTVTTIGINTSHNVNTKTSLAYSFAAVEGFSAFGSYEGTGNAAGPMVNVGFRPAFVMMKSVDSTSSWYIFDGKREGYNVDNDALVADATTVEATANAVDLLSNGFKLRIATDPNVAETFIYAAFAENPFKTANAR